MTDNQKTVITKMRMSGESYNAIARALNISPSTVKSFCIRNDIGIGKHSDGKHCVECGVELTGRQSRFCSESCRHKNWLSTHHDYHHCFVVYVYQCKYCGATFKTIGNKDQKYCSRECYHAARRKAGGNHGE